mmetsp:Transcript_135/g.283  ORF Transcript_135/g.283 Transcript_135/m.283 type:complete len:287 (-) Transcript_135:168-1028(-)
MNIALSTMKMLMLLSKHWPTTIQTFRTLEKSGSFIKLEKGKLDLDRLIDFIRFRFDFFCCEARSNVDRRFLFIEAVRDERVDSLSLSFSLPSKRTASSDAENFVLLIVFMLAIEPDLPVIHVTDFSLAVGSLCRHERMPFWSVPFGSKPCSSDKSGIPSCPLELGRSWAHMVVKGGEPGGLQTVFGDSGAGTLTGYSGFRSIKKEPGPATSPNESTRPVLRSESDRLASGNGSCNKPLEFHLGLADCSLRSSSSRSCRNCERSSASSWRNARVANLCNSSLKNTAC